MLINSSLKIKKDLKDNIETARKSISMFVSRDTSNLSEQYIISASIESMTENITDRKLTELALVSLPLILIFITLKLKVKAAIKLIITFKVLLFI